MRAPSARTRGVRLAFSSARTAVCAGGSVATVRMAAPPEGAAAPANRGAFARSLLRRSSSRKKALTSSCRKSTQLCSFSLQWTGSSRRNCAWSGYGSAMASGVNGSNDTRGIVPARAPRGDGFVPSGREPLEPLDRFEVFLDEAVDHLAHRPHGIHAAHDLPDGV